MHKGFAARQPIFNTRGDVVAYEILYRNSEINCYPVGVSGYVATSSIWVNVFFNINVQKISNGRQIFINIPNTQFLKSIKNKTPDKNIVFEILETFEPNDELFCLVKKMSKRGHIFALDDFIYKEAWDRFLPYIDIIKFDVNDINVKEISREIKKFKSYGITCLLEKVETKECYKAGVKSGFDLFQGYFFGKPEMISFN